MFSFLRGSRRGRKDDKSRTLSPFPGNPETSRYRAVGQSVDDGADDVDDDDYDDDVRPSYRDNEQTSYFDRANVDEYEEDDDAVEDEDDEGDEDEDAVNTPLLPIFSSAHLDRLPLYNITHAIRLLVVQKCETTLSWDQLRSPQISQFLVKPIQSQIRTNHFNRATLCALIANCLQFQKEAQSQPGNVGVLKTRALMSELLAMRLIKEFSTRELIDALSYDFDPLQGMTPPTTATNTMQAAAAWPVHQLDLQGKRAHAKGARVSTVEVAIKAQAKRFLAHQLVVQHLEAIWAGTVVFHSESDNLHRKPSIGEEVYKKSRNGGTRYGTINEHSPSALPADTILSRKAHETRTNKRPSTDLPYIRRSVTLYNPRDASLFKLSRLRVPRYRQIFSTFSFATMLGLFLAVLYERSLNITSLEILFWIWSIGYMLDEVVGFTEQGFGLYILSFWNAFDLGILMLFVIYYCLRLYGIVLAEQNKITIADYAYDVLASTAILLFPRLFSVLDHYRYFSQLLIAFRLMAQDLIAVLILILISCSGFFVAFTLSFADRDTDGNGVAYALFQILMGFTPAAWENWSGYNMLGKAIMTIFLIICHFLIVTILITVLTNSFMAIVQNANEEHQFLFAINTISMVKSDALFSYVAPTNVVEWVLSPLRYIMPFRQYVKFNRTVIKISHFPMLFIIFGYERLILSKGSYGTMELVENQRSRSKTKPVVFSINKAEDLFSPGRRLLKEPSVVSFHKDRALEEVFRRPFKGSTIRNTSQNMETDRRHSSNVDKWMQLAENEGGASPPLEQPRSVVERLEGRRPPFKRATTADRVRMMKRSREFSIATRSMASDPDLLPTAVSRRPHRIDEEAEDLFLSNETMPQETDADGDVENNLESELAGPAIGESAVSIIDKENKSPNTKASDEDDFFHTPNAGESPSMQFSSERNPWMQSSPPAVAGGVGSPYQFKPRPRRMQHDRQASTNTMLFAPQYLQEESSSTNPPKPSRPLTAKNTNGGGTTTPRPINLAAGQRTPKLKPPRARPVMPQRQKTAPNLTAGVGVSFLDTIQQRPRQPSFNARALDLASDIGDNKWAPAVGISGMPNSFSEQIFRERELEREREEARRRSEDEEKGMVNRIMLARMHTLEEGFREVLREIKDMSRSNANTSRDSDLDVSQTKTPSRRQSVNEGKGRKSPRKTQARDSKAKEGKKPAFVVRADEPDQLSPASIRSVVERPKEDNIRDGGGRPTTAVRAQERGSRSD